MFRNPDAMRAAREEIQKIFSGPEGLEVNEKESVNLSREQLDNMPVLGKHTFHSVNFKLTIWNTTCSDCTL